MADIVDLAHEQEEIFRHNALLAHRERTAGEPVEASTNRCVCGALIPAARRRAVPGVRQCVECASKSERARQRFAPLKSSEHLP